MIMADLEEEVKKQGFAVGFDVGSDSVHYAVMDSGSDAEGTVRMTGTLVHHGNPTVGVSKAFDIVKEWLAESGNGIENIVCTSFTGEGGKVIAAKTGCLFKHDSVTIPAGASKIEPDAKYVFHVGAKSPYFFDIEHAEEDGEKISFSPDMGTGTKCGGGSGILIEKQMRRLYLKRILDEDNISDLDERDLIYDYAEKEVEAATVDIEVGGRCGVVIQSDMIHLQNLKYPVNAIVKGMLNTVARNYKSDVVRTRKLKLPKRGKAVFTGGLARNRFIRDELKRLFGFGIEVPDHFLQVGAVGAALKAVEEGSENVFDPAGLDAALGEEIKKIVYAEPLSLVDVEFVDGCDDYDPDAEIEYDIPEGETIDALVGIDGGSTTSKAVVINAETGEMMFKRYLYTDGQPAELGKRLLSEIRDKFGDRINILGARVTGSSSKLYRTLFFHRPGKDAAAADDAVDLAPIKDEITCHAAGIKHFDPEVDTIFELGGQDAKFTRFNGDVVSNSKMNLSCMAGTGQTRQNMAETKGFDVKKKKGKEGKFLEDYAFAAQKIPVCDSTCGVFSEADIKKFIALGLPDEEIAAAIEYAAIAGYVQKFVGNEDVGEVISAQGGPFLSKSTLAALAQLTGRSIKAFPYREVMGAFGAAVSLKQEIDALKEEGEEFNSRFMGYDAIDLEFRVEDIPCRDAIGSENCGTRNCTLCKMTVGDEVTLSNGRCPKGNTGEENIKKTTDYVKTYNRMLNTKLKNRDAVLLSKYIEELEKAAREGDVQETKKDTVGIPRAFSFLNEKGIFYAEFFRELGLKPVVSDEADDYILNLGREFAFSENCVPAMDFYGQVAAMKPYVQKLFLPDATNAITTDGRRQKFCPHSSSISFPARQSLGMPLEKEKDDQVIDPVLHFDDRHRPLEDSLKKELDRAYGQGRFSRRQIARAVEKARLQQAKFIEQAHDMGRSFLHKLSDKEDYGFLMIGRGYTLFDEKASSSTNAIFSNLGLNAIPSYFMDSSSIQVPKVVSNMYWVLGERIISDFVFSLLHPKLFPVLMTNFNCGPDSMLLYHLDRLAKKVGKPYLVLQTDGHNSNAQFETRIRAFSEIAGNYRPNFRVRQQDLFAEQPAQGGMERVLGIPYMGEGSYAFAAALRNEDIKAEVMPTWTKKSQKWAGKLVTTQACKPMHVQVGDIVSFVEEKTMMGARPENLAVFEPSASGPCRFGQYHVVIRDILSQLGYGDVAVVSPSSATNYNDIDLPKSKINKLKLLIYKGTAAIDILRSAFLRTRPYEANPGEAEMTYRESIKAVEYDLEHNTGKGLVGIMEEYAKKFNNVKKQGVRRPIIDFEGEIFVRQHNPANEDAILLAEKNGLEVVIAPTFEWLDYINWLRTYEAGVEARAARSDFFRKAKKWTTGKIKLWYTANVVADLWKPFAEYLKGREFHDPRKLLDGLEPRKMWSKQIEGESPLSVAKSYEFIMHGGKPVEVGDDYAVRSGLMQVGPWGCMQETAAAFTIQCLMNNRRQVVQSADEKLMPYIFLAYGDSAPPNIESEMASFAEQCRLKRRETLKNYSPAPEKAKKDDVLHHFPTAPAP